eukprot:11732742-Alexandrium_andersonii.AAC.1
MLRAGDAHARAAGVGLSSCTFGATDCDPCSRALLEQTLGGDAAMYVGDDGVLNITRTLGAGALGNAMSTNPIGIVLACALDGLLPL